MSVTSDTLYATRFKKITFEIVMNGIPIYIQTLTIAPEELTREDTIDASVTRTLGGAHVDDFGMGLINYELSGTTGYNVKLNAEGRVVDGYIEFKDLRDRIIRYFENPHGDSRERGKDDFALYFHDWAMEEHYVIQPTSRFRLVRSKSRPLLYAYEFSFTVLRATTFNADYVDQVWDATSNTHPRLGDIYKTTLKAIDIFRILMFAAGK